MKEISSRLQMLFSDHVRRSIARIFTAVCVFGAGVIALYMLVMRFAFLSNGLSYDELYSAITASPQFPFKYIWQEMLLKDVNLPLFNVLLWGWNRIFPFTITWMRLFPALTGAAALAVAWFLSPAYWSRLKKYIFVTLLAGSFILVAYGRILRTYSLSVLLTVVFSLLALRFIYRFERGEKPSTGNWLIFFAAGLLGAYSHYFCAALFFITALVVFLYAQFYKVDRGWAFWGTAIVFLGWILWFARALSIVQSSAQTWWIHTPFLKASLNIITFLLGPTWLVVAILYGVVLAGVSVLFTYKKNLLKQADFVLPLAQIVLLCGVVAVASWKVNLWLDRYFLPMLVSVILLFTAFLEHLRKRHLVLLVLWPLLLVGWVQFFWKLDYLSWPEYNGWREAFTRVIQTEKADKLLVDLSKVTYPRAAIMPMFSFYIPEGVDLELIALTAQNVSMSWETNPKTYILVPLCSQVSMIDSLVSMRAETDGAPLLFGHDTCLYTASPLVRKVRNYEKNILSL